MHAHGPPALVQLLLLLLLLLLPLPPKAYHSSAAPRKDLWAKVPSATTPTLHQCQLPVQQAGRSCTGFLPLLLARVLYTCTERKPSHAAHATGVVEHASACANM